MARRRKRIQPKPKPKRDWKTNVWYIVGALIALAMVFSLVAGAFSGSF